MRSSWGWGAIAVDTAPKGWRCPLCRRVNRSVKGAGMGRHYYPFSTVCTDCARAAWYRSQGEPAPAPDPHAVLF